MPIIQSAKKRVRVTEKQSVKNAKTKRSLRMKVKAFQQALTQKKDTTKLQSEAYSAIDTAVKKGVITKNKAARKKNQLNSASKAAKTTKMNTTKKPAKSTKTTKKVSPSTKAATKKSPAKSTTKKTASKTKKATPTKTKK